MMNLIKNTKEKNLFREISIKVAFTTNEVAMPISIPKITETTIFIFPDFETFGCFW